jgi:hypothetical protein
MAPDWLGERQSERRISAQMPAGPVSAVAAAGSAERDTTLAQLALHNAGRPAAAVGADRVLDTPVFVGGVSG